MYHQIRSFAILIACMIITFAVVLAASPVQAAEERCFTQTNHCINGRFRQYWEQNGGLAVFGYPLSAPRLERNRDTGRVYLTQWFERNRFELHSDKPAPYDVLLGRLGDDRLIQQGVSWRQQPRESGPKPGCLWFAQTGRNVCDQAVGAGFMSYWRSHGLQDPRLDGYGRSLQLFGLPLTTARTETNTSGDTVLTQVFERARFEWHPDKPQEFRVLLGLLGDELRFGSGSHPPFAYVDGNAVFRVPPDGKATRVTGLANMGHVLDAVQLGDAVITLRQQGIERATLSNGAYKEVARFGKGEALFGQLVSMPGSPLILYSYVRNNENTPDRFESVVGLYDTRGESPRKIVGLPGQTLVLGLTADNTGILLIRRGQDPSFGTVHVVSVATGETERQISVVGYGGAALSPDRRTIVAVNAPPSPNQALQFYSLSAGGSAPRTVKPPKSGVGVGSMLWAPDGQHLYMGLFGMDGPDAAGSLWRLNVQSGAWTEILPQIWADTQLLGIDSQGRWLMLRGANELEIAGANGERQVVRRIPSEAVVARWR